MYFTRTMQMTPFKKTTCTFLKFGLYICNDDDYDDDESKGSLIRVPRN